MGMCQVFANPSQMTHELISCPIRTYAVHLSDKTTEIQKAEQGKRF